MKVFLATSGQHPVEWTPVPALTRLAGADRFGVHTLTDDPAAADLILFVDAHLSRDWRLRAITRHPLARRYPHEAMVYDERDQPWGTLPGLHVSMPAPAFDPARQRAAPYYKPLNELVAPAPEEPAPDLLFSFLGANTHPVRARVLRLSHPCAVIEDTSAVDFFDFTARRDEGRIGAQKRRYADVLARTKFALCPRGAGTSSIRLYEALRAGRVPVIVSDAWVPPFGPDWGACALRVREADVAGLPRLLESREADFPALARAARAAHREWFADDVMFHRLIEGCGGVMARLRDRDGARDRRRWDLLNRQYLYHALRGVRATARRLVSGESAGHSRG